MISIITASYGHAKYLADHIQSVQAQTYTDWEHVIVDDASPDGTWDRLGALKHPKLILWRNPANIGHCTSRNIAVRLSRGDWLLNLDSDDMLEPVALERLVKLGEQTGADIVYPDLKWIGDRQGESHAEEPNFKHLLQANFMVTTSLVRRTAFMESGGYNLNMEWGYEDWDLWIGIMSRGGTAVHLPMPLLKYRWHGSNQTATDTGPHQDELTRRLHRHYPHLYPPTPAHVANLLKRKVKAMV